VTDEDALIEDITRVKEVTNNVLVEDVLNLEKEMFPSISTRTIHVTIVG
jgi:hypothetical protein